MLTAGLGIESMVRRLLFIVILFVSCILPLLLQADRIYAQGLTLVGDLDYFISNETSTDKETGEVTETDFSRFSQLFKLDFSRFVFPNLEIALGGYLENEDTESDVSATGEEDLSTDRNERSIRPYAEVNLLNPLYKAGLAYRNRSTETSGSLTDTETLTADEFNATLQWRPVDLPLFNLDFLHVEVQNDPLTFDTTRETFNFLSKYAYRDYNFLYSYITQESFNNIEGIGSDISSHKGSIGYSRAFKYRENRFNLSAGARVHYDNVEFLGSTEDEALVDRPAANAGRSFYILNDSPPTSNDPFDLILVEGSNRLTDVNIGRGGGLNPVSAGLSFGVPTEVDTIYIPLTENIERFPELASTTQVSAIADSLAWEVYTSDDQVEFNWTLQPVSSVTYEIVDNRFEIRLASPVNVRRIKVTTVPLDRVAPGEIRFQNIRALVAVSGRAGLESENLEQFYNFRMQWSPSTDTTLGYEAYFRHQEIEPDDATRSTVTNSVFFRHIINPMFLTYGKVYRGSGTRTTPQIEEDTEDMTYSLALRGKYLETLSQSLVYTGTDSSGARGDSSTNSFLLRTDADLYQGWSANLDLSYAFNTLEDGRDQTVKRARLRTIVEPNRSVTLSLDYSLNLSEEEGRVDSTNQFGTFQLLWAMTDTLSMFFRYNFRDQEGETEDSTFQRSINLNWAPFPGGDLQFSIGYNESTDRGDRESRTVNPVVIWRIARGIFLDLRYTNGTTDTPTETSDFYSVLTQLRFFY
jgi:hypothetical protein